MGYVILTIRYNQTESRGYTNLQICSLDVCNKLATCPASTNGGLWKNQWVSHITDLYHVSTRITAMQFSQNINELAKLTPLVEVNSQPKVRILP
ncbi:hypothetical protein [Salmonella enterica]